MSLLLNQPNTFENEPIKGFTPRILYYIVAQTVVIVATVLGCYFGQQITNKVQDIQISTLQLQFQQLQGEYRDQQTQINQKQDKNK